MEQLLSMSRRDLLKRGSILIVSFAFRAPAQTGTNSEIGKPLDLHELDSFLAIHPDSSVTIYTSKVDIGTGMRIAMRQMVSEELGVSVSRMNLVEGDTALTPDQGGTGGSTGLTRGGVELRQAAATARQELLNRAAARLNRPASELTIENGQVRPVNGGQGVEIGTLGGGRRLSVKMDPKAPLRDPLRYTVVGKPLLRPDVPEKCTGRHTYLPDLTIPGMLHGRVIRPPSFGAKLLSVDESSIRSIPDVRVVRVESFLGVVARDEWAAVRASRELKATWSEWQGLPGSDGLDRHLRQGAIDHDETVVNRGDASAMASATRKLSATYQWPCQSHGSIGPSCAVADVRDGGATIWSASQGTHGLGANLAKIFGFAPEKVRVIYMDGAGSYGTNGGDDAAADAVLLSRAVSQPVRVQWMRQDELAWDPKGPPQLLDVRAGLDPSGNIVAWETEMWLPANRPGARPLVGVDAAGMKQDHGVGSGAVSQNGDPPYSVANVRVVSHWLKDTPLRPSNLRAPGKIANVFAVEGLTDEIAVAAGIDAADYRLQRLSDPRAIAVLKRAAEMIGWQTRPSPNAVASQGSLLVGRGVAYMRYKQAENYVAIAMEVAVDRSSGKISVRRVTCAHDCGLVVNPDSLRNQIEGSIVQTLSRAMHEEVKFDRSRVTSVDWASYPILTFPEVPAIEVALLDHPELPLLGAGEAATAPVAGALGNAIFDATGVRLRAVPFTPARVKAALAGGAGIQSSR
ncbi:MAG: molybdopterin cofactor-binding domain-containing protein [Bryobacteraceae bacterium]